MNDIILTIFIIHFTASAFVCMVFFPIEYADRFYSPFRSVSFGEIAFMGLLGVILGWLVTPVILLKGFIKVLNNVVEELKESEE